MAPNQLSASPVMMPIVKYRSAGVAAAAAGRCRRSGVARWRGKIANIKIPTTAPEKRRREEAWPSSSNLTAIVIIMTLTQTALRAAAHRQSSQSRHSLVARRQWRRHPISPDGDEASPRLLNSCHAALKHMIIIKPGVKSINVTRSLLM